MQTTKLIILLTFLIVASMPETLLSQSPDKIIEAYRIEEPPKIDGYLNDDVWQGIPATSDFVQHEPVSGIEPTYRTEMKIAYDEDNLYLAVMCYDDEPEKIIARALKWDGKMSGDDHVMILFDTFNDDRSAYWFATNPLGMHDDAMLMGYDMGGFNESWNGIWEVEGAITPDGWSVEFAFPFSTLKFRDIEDQVWGFNLLREIKRTGENILWTAYEPDQGIFKINKAGSIVGMKGLERGDPIYIKPFVTAGTQQTPDFSENVFEPGLDLKYGITETLSLDLTFNTDFAQVESDRARINLTRFPLFFPEKRDFFLEGASVFDFELGGSNEVFYSRRIGLHDGEEIPIIAGAKLVGKINKSDVGLITMQTAEKHGEPSTNYTVARMKYDVFGHSYVGFIATSKHTGKTFSQSFGADIAMRFDDFLGDKNLNIEARVAKTNEQHNEEDSWAGIFAVDYPNDLISTYVSYQAIQDHYKPEMGFVRRTGYHQFDYQLKIQPRVEFGSIKKILFRPTRVQMMWDKNNELITAFFAMDPFGFTTNEGDQLQLELNRSFDRVDDSFTVFGDNLILAGEYWMNQFEAHFRSSSGRIIYGDMDYSYGEYYTGIKHSFETSVAFAPFAHLTVSADYEYNDIELDGGSFSTNEIGTSIRYDFSTLTNTSLFAQYNNEIEQVNLNYRFNWQPKIGSNFYLVVNQLLSTEDKIRSLDLTVLAKMVWLFTL